jgi:hypothetical protein
MQKQTKVVEYTKWSLESGLSVYKPLLILSLTRISTTISYQHSDYILQAASEILLLIFYIFSFIFLHFFQSNKTLFQIFFTTNLHY